MSYQQISMLVWGCVPIDKEWAVNTVVYKKFLKENNLYKVDPKHN